MIICDPFADKEAVKHEYGVELTKYSPELKVDAIIAAVNHDIFKKDLTVNVLKKHLANKGTKGVVVDVKGMFDSNLFDELDMLYWRL